MAVVAPVEVEALMDPAALAPAVVEAWNRGRNTASYRIHCSCNLAYILEPHIESAAARSSALPHPARMKLAEREDGRVAEGAGSGMEQRVAKVQEAPVAVVNSEEVVE